MQPAGTSKHCLVRLAQALGGDAAYPRTAIGKAHGALAMGVGSRTLGKRAEERPHFIAAVTDAIGGSMIPVPGGVLIKGEGGFLGAVGVTGIRRTMTRRARWRGSRRRG